MKRHGKIILEGIVILVMVLACIGIWLTSTSSAATNDWPAKTLIIPFNGETALTVVFRDAKTGNIVHGTAGTSTAATTWDNGEIAAVAHSISGDWMIAVPSVTRAFPTLYFTIYYAAPADITKATVPSAPKATLYDTRSGKTYTDTVPVSEGEVRSRTFIE